MKTPNIILFMTDQQRADMTRGDGFSLDTMPFLDSWSSGGVRFKNAYTPSPLCVPARLSIFTGRFPKAHRVRDNFRSGSDLYKPAHDLIDVLRDAGYQTALVGKNHSYLGADSFDVMETYGHHGYLGDRQLPVEHSSFDEWLRSRGNRISREATPFPAECQQPARIVSDAITYVDAHSADPFFLWVSLPEPHNPSQVSEPYFSMFDTEGIPPAATGAEDALRKGGKWKWMAKAQRIWNPNLSEDALPFRKAYCGMLRLIDDQFARLVDHLKKTGIYDDTFIIYLSDHGDYVFEYGLHGKGVGLPECLVRVPLSITGPGVRAAVNGADFVSLTDLFPTLCEVLGVEIPAGVQGRSILPILFGEPYPSREFASVYAEVGVGDLYVDPEDPAAPPLSFPLPGKSFDGLNNVSMSGKLKMVRWDRWKLTADMQGRVELFDLSNDPYELVNRAGDPALVGTENKLMRELLAWTIRTEDDMPKGTYERFRHPRNWYREQS